MTSLEGIGNAMPFLLPYTNTYIRHCYKHYLYNPFPVIVIADMELVHTTTALHSAHCSNSYAIFYTSKKEGEGYIVK